MEGTENKWRTGKARAGVVAFVVVVMLMSYLAIRRERSKHEHRPTEKNLPDTISNSLDIEKGIDAKPAQNKRDKSVAIVQDYIKQAASNPKSVLFLEWSDVSPSGNYWKVRCKYKSVSSFNAEVTTNAWFYIQRNKVIQTRVISKI